MLKDAILIFRNNIRNKTLKSIHCVKGKDGYSSENYVVKTVLES